jgi:translation initiation factor IF-2
MILLVADMHDLKSEIEVPAEGLVIESFMDSLKGPIVTAIIKKGILRPKDIIATDLALAKVKSVKDFMGREIEGAYPAQPAIILGFEKVPAVGEKFKSYKTAEEAMQKIKKEEPKREIGSTVIDSDPNKKVLNIILKGDVFGSLEAVEGMLKNLPQEKVILRILKSEVGEINESDAKLAEMSKAEIVGFRTKISPTVMKFMKNDLDKKLRIKTFDVIYELIQNVRFGLEKTLEPEIVRKDIGKLTEGELKKGLKLEIFRDDKKIGTGRIINLQRDKKDIDKLSKGQEAGILFEGNVKIEKGDILQAYTEERKKGEL